jgi:K(+)-stimulated pyrophosphate-energized sodium pump
MLWFAILASVIALAYAGYLAWFVLKHEPGSKRMIEIASAIEEGAMAYLNRQYTTVAVFVVIIAGILYYPLGLGWQTSVNFVLGAVLSGLAGYIGMLISVRANVRTANAAQKGIRKALSVAFSGGAVTGFAVVGLGLLGVSAVYLIFRDLTMIIGFGFGASLISLFARVGGGIYTKGADVGADLVGKIEAGIPEDDPRNPAVIADNVGDNVGDCAGMAADLFESYAVTAIAAMLLGGVSAVNPEMKIVYPLLLGGAAIFASIIGTWFVRTNSPHKVWAALNRSILVSSILSAALFFAVNYFTFPNDYSYLWAAMTGLVTTVVIGLVTEYYTSASKGPTRSVAEAAKTGAGTNVIMGIAKGMESTLIPVLVICGAIYVSYTFAGIYGIAIAAMAMLSLTGIIVSVDSYGPITDNAGGIAEMSNLPSRVRKQVTDPLDAVGNTTKAVTKGFAIGAAALAALSLFAAFAEDAGITNINILEPKVVIGLFIGGMLPFIFSSLTMKAVGKAAFKIVEEVRRQFKTMPGIMKGTQKPDYAKCVDISTKAAIKELLLPGLLSVFSPVLVYYFMGAEALGGLLAGVIVTGLLLAITMTTGGAAWDNAKKFIEMGSFGGKGSDAHKAAVVGDTVGDAFKDTSGPALNPLIKVINTISLLMVSSSFLVALV